jgi:hypothetical protein
MSACDEQTDRTRLTDLFNLGFRRGANDCASVGLSHGIEPGQPMRPAPPPPPAPTDLKKLEQAAWERGYAMGYKIGASDAELASVEVPGACGMISGLGQEILEAMGLFRCET